MDNKTLNDILESKANEVKQYLVSLDYRCTYTPIQFGINFTVHLARQTAQFTIYYKPKNNTWKLHTVDEWVTSELKSRIMPLLGLQHTLVHEHRSTATKVPGDPSSYFEAAIEYLHILQPFAKEYIDFAIICEQVKIGLQGILSDSRYAYLDQQALQEAWQKPLSPDFLYAKEYLTQCLRICQIPTPF
ncbi:hypothetical protein KSB_45210 [Ktedonobacter robiniae]|uniref:DUF4304 domain-containing protein n=2 Tax=Ktedonobacter robiniae TaxID=2778365 RepID=A0ABQ3UTD3_9CHLR|nr:hypothetical protein KSB_45210 [Ktedonobacter robiniae]